MEHILILCNSPLGACRDFRLVTVLEANRGGGGGSWQNYHHLARQLCEAFTFSSGNAGLITSATVRRSLPLGGEAAPSGSEERPSTDKDSSFLRGSAPSSIRIFQHIPFQLLGSYSLSITALILTRKTPHKPGSSTRIDSRQLRGEILSLIQQSQPCSCRRSGSPSGHTEQQSAHLHRTWFGNLNHRTHLFLPSFSPET